MGRFLTDKDILKLIDDGKLISKYYDKIMIDSIMYDLRLGKEVFVTPDKKITNLDQNDIISIESGQFALLTTREYLNIPNDVFSLITIKMKYKAKGLTNISGFHVDPGFQGYLVFSVYNVGPSTITLRYEDPVFAIMFYKLDDEVKPKERIQENIPTWMIEPLVGLKSPSILELENKINRNSSNINTLITLFVAILGTIIVSILLYFQR